MVKKATVLMKMSDYAKFDVRLDQSGRYFFIDSNANPAMGPKRISTPMGFIIEELYAIPFSEIMSRLITNTIVEARSGVKQD
jgi:D-alanine-D-alanine ligase-like ATP-grasp enzyme